MKYLLSAVVFGAAHQSSDNALLRTTPITGTDHKPLTAKNLELHRTFLDHECIGRTTASALNTIAKGGKLDALTRLSTRNDDEGIKFTTSSKFRESEWKKFEIDPLEPIAAANSSLHPCVSNHGKSIPLITPAPRPPNDSTREFSSVLPCPSDARRLFLPCSTKSITHTISLVKSDETVEGSVHYCNADAHAEVLTPINRMSDDNIRESSSSFPDIDSSYASCELDKNENVVASHPKTGEIFEYFPSLHDVLFGLYDESDYIEASRDDVMTFTPPDEIPDGFIQASLVTCSSILLGEDDTAEECSTQVELVHWLVSITTLLVLTPCLWQILETLVLQYDIPSRPAITDATGNDTGLWLLSSFSSWFGFGWF